MIYEGQMYFVMKPLWIWTTRFFVSSKALMRTWWLHSYFLIIPFIYFLLYIYISQCYRIFTGENFWSRILRYLCLKFCLPCTKVTRKNVSSSCFLNIIFNKLNTSGKQPKHSSTLNKFFFYWKLGTHVTKPNLFFFTPKQTLRRCNEFKSDIVV